MPNCPDVVNFVNILVAIRWVAKAWSMVKAETISKCFRKAEILDSAMYVVTRGLEDDDEDPFLDSDVRMLQSLIDKTMTAGRVLALGRMISVDNF